MSFKGTEGGPISLQLAGEWTQNWRTNHPGAKKGLFIGRDAIEDLLNQEGCMGIRIYFAINNEDAHTAVLVGAGTDEDDMTEIVVDMGVSCPPFCGNNNVLNGN